MLDKHTVDWTKGEKVWSSLPLPPSRWRDSSSPRLCPAAHLLPPHARSAAAPRAGARHTQKVWKPKRAPDETFFLAGVNLISCPAPRPATLPTSSPEFLPIEFKALIVSHKASSPWGCSEATRPPALQVQGDKAVSSGCRLELLCHPALGSCLVGLSDACKSSGMLWRLRRWGCQRSRKGGRSVAAQLACWICVRGRQVHNQLFLLFLDLCVCLKICTSSAI